MSYAKNSWKFWLDEYANVAPVIAVLDDDACLVDHIVPADVLDGQGKIIQHGIQLRGGGDYAAWMSDIHLPYLAHFMTEFPVYFWRDMLPDLRAWMVKEGVNETISLNATRAKEQFWRAYANLFNRGGHKSEFNLIHNWAAADEKWKHNYSYRIAPQNLSLGTSFHQHKPGCASKKHLSQRYDADIVARTWREHLLFYPNTVNHAFEVLDGGGAGAIRFRGFLFGANPKDRKWSEHFAKQNSTEWTTMLRTHDDAVAAYKERGHALSYAEVIPDVVVKWAKCFNYRGRPAGPAQ